MKAGTVQIAWHDSEPVLSLDFHPGTGLLATAGADRDIKLWYIQQSDNPKLLPKVTFDASLSYHTTAINVIRFSPSGEELASGADGGEIFIWKVVHNKDNVPVWKVLKTLHFHPKDVLDICWSPDGNCLASASVDNTCIVWDITKDFAGSPQQVITDHLHYVQGVAWDPAGQYLASMSADRTCRVYSCKSQRGKGLEKMFVSQHVLMKAEAAGVQSEGENSKTKHHLFFDETMPSFFRRLAWSPDGSFLLVPAGVYKLESTSHCAAYAFSRNELSKPVFTFPGMCKAVVAVRFCPVVFELYESNRETTPFNLPYRMVYAIATLNSVSIYDTQQMQPLALLGAIHYAAITDLAWSPDAKFLVISSTDGYCTIAEFGDGDLGRPLASKDLPRYVAARKLGPRIEAGEAPQRQQDEQMRPEEPMDIDAVSKPTEEPVNVVAKPAEEPVNVVAKPVEVDTGSARPTKIRRITPVLIEHN